MFNAESTCYSTKAICHGMPVGERCMGHQEFKTVFVEKSECNNLEEINQRCESLGQKVCEINQDDIGKAWASKAAVYGKTCEKWGEEFNISLRSC